MVIMNCYVVDYVLIYCYVFRFEKLVFVGVCEDHEGQVKILKAVTSKLVQCVDNVFIYIHTIL